MSVERRSTWMARTGQRWKLYLFGLFMLVSGCALAGVILLTQRPQRASGAISCAFVGIGFGLGAFLWLGLSVRCPKCKGKVGWRVLKTSSAGEWWMRLIAMDECPCCASRAGGKPSSA